MTQSETQGGGGGGCVFETGSCYVAEADPPTTASWVQGQQTSRLYK